MRHEAAERLRAAVAEKGKAAEHDLEEAQEIAKNTYTGANSIKIPADDLIGGLGIAGAPVDDDDDDDDDYDFMETKATAGSKRPSSPEPRMRTKYLETTGAPARERETTPNRTMTLKQEDSTFGQAPAKK
ncbi:MAG: hypothetical protein Q9161_003905 [Pseudevernia consocians]